MGDGIYITNMKIDFQINEGESYQLVKSGSLWDIPMKN